MPQPSLSAGVVRDNQGRRTGDFGGKSHCWGYRKNARLRLDCQVDAKTRDSRCDPIARLRSACRRAQRRGPGARVAAARCPALASLRPSSERSSCRRGARDAGLAFGRRVPASPTCARPRYRSTRRDEPFWLGAFASPRIASRASQRATTSRLGHRHKVRPSLHAGSCQSQDQGPAGQPQGGMGPEHSCPGTMEKCFRGIA